MACDSDEEEFAFDENGNRVVQVKASPPSVSPSVWQSIKALVIGKSKQSRPSPITTVNEILSTATKEKESKDDVADDRKPAAKPVSDTIVHRARQNKASPFVPQSPTVQSSPSPKLNEIVPTPKKQERIDDVPDDRKSAAKTVPGPITGLTRESMIPLMPAPQPASLGGRKVYVVAPPGPLSIVLEMDIRMVPVVRHVLPESPMKNVIQPGDILLAVEGVSMQGRTSTNIITFLGTLARQPQRRMTLWRAGRRHEQHQHAEAGTTSALLGTGRWPTAAPVNNIDPIMADENRQKRKTQHVLWADSGEPPQKRTCTDFENERAAKQSVVPVSPSRLRKLPMNHSGATARSQGEVPANLKKPPPSANPENFSHPGTLLPEITSLQQKSRKRWRKATRDVELEKSLSSSLLSMPKNASTVLGGTTEAEQQVARERAIAFTELKEKGDVDNNASIILGRAAAVELQSARERASLYTRLKTKGDNEGKLWPRNEGSPPSPLPPVLPPPQPEIVTAKPRQEYIANATTLTLHALRSGPWPSPARPYDRASIASRTLSSHKAHQLHMSMTAVSVSRFVLEVIMPGLLRRFPESASNDADAINIKNDLFVGTLVLLREFLAQHATIIFGCANLLTAPVGQGNDDNKIESEHSGAVPVDMAMRAPVGQGNDDNKVESEDAGAVPAEMAMRAKTFSAGVLATAVILTGMVQSPHLVPPETGNYSPMPQFTTWVDKYDGMEVDKLLKISQGKLHEGAHVSSAEAAMCHVLQDLRSGQHSDFMQQQLREVLQFQTVPAASSAAAAAALPAHHTTAVAAAAAAIRPPA